MSKIIIESQSPFRAGLPARSHEIIDMLGIPLKKLPDEGMGPVNVQGISMWVRPIERVPGKKSSKHRVMCMCPPCGKVISAGRLHQHVCKKGGV